MEECPITVKDAFETLAVAMRTNPEYAWSWHCNVAMGAYDAGCDHETANKGAARFMQVAFQVDMTQSPFYRDLMKQYEVIP